MKLYRLTYACPNCESNHQFVVNVGMLSFFMSKLIDDDALPIMIEDAVQANIDDMDNAEMEGIRHDS